jgi:hypothetical protein
MAENYYSNGDIVKPSGINELAARSFDWTVKTTTYTAVDRDQVMADTSSAAWTLTLPSSPGDGDMIGIADAADTFDSKNLTIDGNGTNIHGDSTLVVDVKNASFFLRYSSTQSEWRITGI